MSLSKETGMPRSNRQVSVGDRISALPNELLHHVMSFLTAREAVHTCVLSRRWQNVWASLRCLNIDAAKFTSLERFKKFVDNLLLHRGCTPLDTLWLRITFDDSSPDYLSDYSQIRPWVCHALRSNAQVLGVVHGGDNFTIESAFTSLHLKRLHLNSFIISDWFLKKLFSGCPALEELELIGCSIHKNIVFSCTKLKKLTVDGLYLNEDFVIDMPNLVSLSIDGLLDGKLYLVDVSSLETASIYFDGHEDENPAVDCNILSALSKATSLESLSLDICDKAAIKVLGRDVLGCGTFSNLTTLSLGERCLGTGCSVLLHLLRRSPKIQKLILHLTEHGASHYDHPEQPAAALTDPACNEIETPFNCENLKKIEINCPQGVKRIHVIVRILFANITSPTEINITSH